MPGLFGSLFRSRWLWRAAPWVVTSIFAGQAGAVDAPAVTIDTGAVSGVSQNGVDEYLGIPYAAPPLGALRWRPPEPAKPWTTTLKAVAKAASCAQGSELGVFAAPSEAEDCLYVNVYAPKVDNQSKAKHPVLVWFHGGGYFVGSGNDYDGAKLAAEGGAVVVTVNYRLGILGFLAHPALDKEGHPFGNYGLIDQQFAMKWVKRNIGAFGGNPDDVTISGESSGCTAVMSHLISPGAAGLFQHAVCMTGSSIIIKNPAFGAPRPIDYAENVGTKVAEALDCKDQSVECLRNVPVRKILAAQSRFMIEYQAGIIDGTTIPMPYGEAFKSGHVNHVTVVNGTTRDEWRWAVGFGENATGKAMLAAGYPAAVEGFYGKELAPKVLAEYSLQNYLSPSVAFSAAVTDYLFACTGRKVNQWLADQMPTYAYEFADRTAPSYLAPTSFDLGAAHTYELSYLFPHYHGARGVMTNLNTWQEGLSSKMVKYWTSVDNASQWGSWQRYDAKQDNYIRLILPEPEMTAGTFGREHHCEFWDGTGLY
jgi:para-nitrobenzyl esterase